MPARLKDRNRQVPGGLRYLVVQTGWKPAPYSSFKTIVDGVLFHYRANPGLAQKHGWSLDWETVASQVDAYNAKLCEANGWTDFIIQTGGGQAAPKPQARSLPQNVASIAAGAGVLKDMFGPEGPVSGDIATRRAAVCVACPKNEHGTHWSNYFTGPTSAWIKRGIEFLAGRALSTPHDSKLNFCSVCLCPLRTKVWAKMSHILKHIPADDKAALPSNCWILRGQE
jgi:hypothetical protein